MNTDATAALAAALQTILSDFDREPDDEYMAVAVPMFLSLIDGWTLVNDVDFHAELTDDELATCAAMNFGEGLIENKSPLPARFQMTSLPSGLTETGWFKFS